MIIYNRTKYKELTFKSYQKEKRRLQIELLKLQEWVIQSEKRLAIVLDGKVISAPNINEPITSGNGVISGNFSLAHGDPIHIGSPIEIGINNILSPDWGDAPRKKNENEDSPTL